VPVASDSGVGLNPRGGLEEPSEKKGKIHERFLGCPPGATEIFFSKKWVNTFPEAWKIIFA
jgi:hypothetical protein